MDTCCLVCLAKDMKASKYSSVLMQELHTTFDCLGPIQCRAELHWKVFFENSCLYSSLPHVSWLQGKWSSTFSDEPFSVLAISILLLFSRVTFLYIFTDVLRSILRSVYNHNSHTHKQLLPGLFFSLPFSKRKSGLGTRLLMP